jgi:hypothetical protein
MAKNEKQSSNEREHSWQHDEPVQIGEDFLLFDTNRHSTQIRYSDDGLFAGLKSSIRLETGFFGKLALSLIASPYTKERSAVLTPFERDQGYPLDQEDLSGQRRAAKMHRMKRELAGTIQGLYLFAFVTYESVEENALIQAFLQESSQIQESEQAARLRRLFLTLKFPGGASFTAQAQVHTQQTFLLFRTFFPSDTGPLPRVGKLLSSPQPFLSEHAGDSGQGQRLDRTEGFDLLMPFDLAKLQTIRAQFLFLAMPEG